MSIFLVLICAPFSYAFSQSPNIGQRTVAYTDSVRERPVKIEIWYPTSEEDIAGEKMTHLPFVLRSTIRGAAFLDTKHPLIVLSHGTGGNRFGLAWLALGLAEHGYIVAAPDHWGNTFDNKIPEYFVRHWERPLDIRFLLDKLLSDEDIGKLIDPDQIGMAGFSLGGYTALAIAGAASDCNLLKANAKTKQGKKETNIPELGDLSKLIDGLDCESVPSNLKDKRVKAVVALSPALGLGFERKDQTENIHVPVLIIGVQNDQITPVNTNAKKYHELIETAEYHEISGKASHYVFLNEADETLKKEAKKYYRDDKSVNRADIHKSVESKTVSFFEKHLVAK